MSQLKAIAERFGVPLEELQSWSTSFKSGTKYFNMEEAPAALYTDGDDGVMLFDTFCECFEDEGVQVSIVGEWCDISFHAMEEIGEELLAAVCLIADEDIA